MKPNLNRVITGFLLLATLTSTAAYLLINTNTTPENTKAQVASEEKKIFSDKAFIEALPEESLLLDDTSYTAGTSTDLTSLIPTIKISPTTNLTDAIAQRLAYKFVQDNPTGPQSSDQLVPLPSVQDILDQLATSGITEKGQLPDWEAEAGRLAVQLQENYTQKDIEKYVATFNELAQKYIGNTKLEAQLKDEDGDSSLVLASLDALQNELQKVPTPKPLAAVQWSFMRLVHYQQKALQIIAKEDDPMRTALAIESQVYNYELAGVSFKDEVTKANALPGVALLEGSSHLGLGGKVLSFLGIPTAHAILGIGDITLVTIDNLRREIFQFIKNKAVQILKDKLIKRIIQDTLNWVNGDFKGKPSFVTNWKQYLGDAANSFAGAAIKKFVPELCQPFSLQLRLKLEQINLTDEKPTCTIDKVVQNVKAFYEDFSQGGWIAYTSTILPSGNYYGQLDTATQAVAARTKKEKEVKATEAASSEGFLPTEKCVAWDDTCPTLDSCMASIDRGGSASDTASLERFCRMTSSCPPNDIEPVCRTKEATTLGKIIGTATDNSQNKDLDRIIDERDWKTLLQMFANAAFNRLVAKGVEGVAGLFADKPGACEGAADEKKCFLEDVCKELKDNLEEYNDCMGDWTPVNCDAALARPQSAGSGSATGGQGGGGGTGGTNDATCLNDCISQCTQAGGTDCGTLCVPQCPATGGTTGAGGRGGSVNVAITARQSPVPCTGGAPGAITASTTDRTCEQQCGSGCSCNCGGTAISSSDFCFFDALLSAQNAVFADCLAGIPVGLTSECSDRARVTDDNSYAAALKRKLEAGPGGLSVNIQDELQISGTCNQQFCGAGGCVEPGPRKENYKIVNSDLSLAGADRTPKAICTAGAP